MMKYFGPKNMQLSRSLRLDNEIIRVDIPVGVPCAHCDELIQDGDHGWTLPHIGANGCIELPWHLNCLMRHTIGSVAHIERRCGCFVKGATEDDAPELTRRQAADAAVEAFNRKDKQNERQPTIVSCLFNRSNKGDE